MSRIQRMTVRYDRSEDRLLLLLGDETDQAAAVWMTQRLLRMLVPEILSALDRAEQQSPSEPAGAEPPPHEAVSEGGDAEVASRSFWRQTTADLERKRGVPVDPATVVGDTHLLTGVRMTRKGTQFSLELQWDGGTIKLPATTRYLRQMLRVIYNNCRKADWPTRGIWPDWFNEDAYRQFVDDRQIN